ncbi:MAG: helix-turn-helix domain-containing protein [Clostridium perfringens]|uniref:helix-turn-helix domain-containing protein n=1 Tax=Clostridium perfringens TaxID=1502 RepID=UPI001FAF70D2|nr:helix-turn-helix domain-containing protein [Clostridium perfringens]MDT7914691.1 helix-turn-helix domain-containing protein [Clostridium perfringens]MDT7927825.1 helix-turn-helix domain-containing protein [Clostridium perfringens]MDT7960014.1 helix-turn-helix domain-containing protein [Clostridium perfringens]MDT7976589.1 helix-turn-helix domain-containing protein [Clostridium perfringens]MDT7979695.1 helix-turn-helix domain-containing protein [Clostridium perfringens]
MANKEVNSNKRGYTILENDVLDNPNLNMQEQSLLIALISYNHKEKGYAYPNYEQLKLRSKIKDNRTLSKNINSLIEKKFIKKETIKGRGCKYYINLPSGELHHVENSTTCKNTLPPSGELHYDLVENSTTTITNTITNKNTNIYSSNEEDSISYLEKIDREIDDLENEINNKYDKDLVTKEKEKLINKNLGTLDLLRELKKQLDKNIKKSNKEKTYMDLTFIDDVIDKVKITKEQYDSLIDKFNKDLVQQQILSLDNYIVNGKGAKYKDHYRAINNWCIKNNKDKAKSKEEPKRRGTNLDDL